MFPPKGVPQGRRPEHPGNTWLGLQTVPLAKSTGHQDNIAGSHPSRSPGPEFPSSQAFGMVLEPILRDLLLGKQSSAPGDRPGLPLAKCTACGTQDPDLSGYSLASRLQIPRVQFVPGTGSGSTVKASCYARQGVKVAVQQRSLGHLPKWESPLSQNKHLAQRRTPREPVSASEGGNRPTLEADTEETPTLLFAGWAKCQSCNLPLTSPN